LRSKKVVLYASALPLSVIGVLGARALTAPASPYTPSTAASIAVQETQDAQVIESAFRAHPSLDSGHLHTLWRTVQAEMGAHPPTLLPALAPAPRVDFSKVKHEIVSDRKKAWISLKSGNKAQAAAWKRAAQQLSKELEPSFAAAPPAARWTSAVATEQVVLLEKAILRDVQRSLASVAPSAPPNAVLPMSPHPPAPTN
jgi:hypothetical protein